MLKNFFGYRFSVLLKAILTFTAYRPFEVDKPRVASNDMPNHFLFGVAFDDPALEAKLFVFTTGNLPPLKEAGQADCGRANQTHDYESEDPFVEASASYLALFASGCDGLRDFPLHPPPNRV